ncbi:c-type cytochrome [Roseateles sp. BYS87W]|uniref:C-type cytochrome n=1 Tax=Pelomonas baiyunensis TaxID=3299026 RepID=A0ABW7H4N9_9BURK
MRIALITASVLTLTLAPLGTAWAGPDDALAKAGCVACHAQDKKLVGPSFKDIAAKYRGQKDASATLTDKVRKGGKGVWGPIPMPPHGTDKMADADLKAALDWVLALP